MSKVFSILPSVLSVKMPQSLKQSRGDRLIDHIGRVLIIAYRESTLQLEAAFAREGIPCEVVRQEDNPDYQGYAAIYRCMLNHLRAWTFAAQQELPTLIVEADFVPVVGLAQLPLPFNPEQSNVGISWLYTCAPQIYSISPQGYAEGFSTALVAYIVTPQGAASLCGLANQITVQHGTGYYNFDSEIDKYLRIRGFKNYIPFRNYGEHGGRSNPEHRHNGMSGIHRADVLFGKLAFLPDYAIGKNQAFFLFKARLRARIKGIGRLLTGRFLRWKIVRQSSTPNRLFQFALQRHLTIDL